MNYPIPTGRIDTEPAGPADSNPAEREARLRRTLRGVDLGAFDDLIATWLAAWPDTTVLTVCSWLERVREAERHAVAAHLQAEVAQLRADYDQTPPERREPEAEQEQYRAGLLRATHVLRRYTDFFVTDDAQEPARQYLAGPEGVEP